MKWKGINTMRLYAPSYGFATSVTFENMPDITTCADNEVLFALPAYRIDHTLAEHKNEYHI